MVFVVQLIGIIPGSSIYQVLFDSRKDLEASASLKIVKIAQGTRPNYYHVSSGIMFLMLTLIFAFLIGFIILIIAYIQSRSKFKNFQVNLV